MDKKSSYISPFVEPDVFLLSEPKLDDAELQRFLARIGAPDFFVQVREAREVGMSDVEILCSVMAKNCYMSFGTGINTNINSVRSIPDNLDGVLKAAHGEIVSHGNFSCIGLNFSKLMLDELTRHHVGWVFSVESGRYVRRNPPKDNADAPPLSSGFVRVPELAIAEEGWREALDVQYRYYRYLCDAYCLNGMEGLRRASVRYGFSPFDSAGGTDDELRNYAQRTFGAPNGKPFDPDKPPFEHIKRYTSLVRRYLGSGWATSIGFTVNARAIRHFIQMRSVPYAVETEIRMLAAAMYRAFSRRYPHMFADATVTIEDGLPYIRGMKMQPYDTQEGDPK